MRGSATVPGDVAVAGPSFTEPQVLTEVNADVLEYRALAQLEEIWFESSHDGRKVQGWLLEPPGFDPAKKYPLILEIHGGPFAAYGPGFDLEKQLMAAAGYMVLYTNPRGSTSYGEGFGNLIHHAYPGDDFHDLMSGVDAVIARGAVDEEQLFVTGGSGGGVLTSWTIGRTDRFRAAVTVYPVINWTSWVLSADIPDFGAKYWFPGLPWEYPENYAKRSLLSVVENVEDADHGAHRRGGLPHADVRVGAVLRRAQAARRRGGSGALPGREPRHRQAPEPSHVEGRAHRRLDGRAQKGRRRDLHERRPAAHPEAETPLFAMPLNR